MPVHSISLASSLKPFIKLLLPSPTAANTTSQRHNLTKDYKIPIVNRWSSFNFYGHSTNGWALYNMLNLTQARIHPIDELLDLGIPIIDFDYISFNNSDPDAFKYIWCINYGNIGTDTDINREYISNNADTASYQSIDELKKTLISLNETINKLNPVISVLDPNLLKEHIESAVNNDLKRLIKLSCLFEQFIDELEKNPEYRKAFETLYPIPIQTFFHSDTVNKLEDNGITGVPEYGEIKAIACKDEHRTIIENMTAQSPYQLPIAPMDKLFDDIDKYTGKYTDYESSDDESMNITDIQARYNLFTDLVNYKYPS